MEARSLIISPPLQMILCYLRRYVYNLGEWTSFWDEAQLRCRRQCLGSEEQCHYIAAGLCACVLKSFTLEYNMALDKIQFWLN